MEQQHSKGQQEGDIRRMAVLVNMALDLAQQPLLLHSWSCLEEKVWKDY